MCLPLPLTKVVQIYCLNLYQNRQDSLFTKKWDVQFVMVIKGVVMDF